MTARFLKDAGCSVNIKTAFQPGPASSILRGLID